jgi:hypothetical protein
LIEAGGTCTPAGTLTIGDNGSGVLSVSGSLQAQAIILGSMVGGSGQMNIMPNGTVTYTGRLSAGGTLVNLVVGSLGSATITIDGGGTLTGKGAGTPPDVIGRTANVTVSGAWTNVNGIFTAGTLTVSAGGALNVNCPACYIPSSSLWAFELVAGAVSVFGNLTTTGGLIASGNGTPVVGTLTVGGEGSLNDDSIASFGTVTLNGNASLKANTIGVYQGTFAVENSATLIATSVGVYGTGNLVAETGGVIDANQFRVSSGIAVVQPGSALTMTNPPPENGQVIVQGNGSAHPGVLTIDGQLNNAGYVGVFSDGTLTIGNGQTVTFSAALYGRADLRLNGGRST